MIDVAGIRFKRVGKIYYFSPGDLKLNQGDHVIVETSRGI
ncbi:MAG: stage 0 sporulation protein, partial [Ruminococcaceae bacterium]|nr:stage 0 sporulation protein [Oscillospiraceae bacterium]